MPVLERFDMGDVMKRPTEWNLTYTVGKGASELCDSVDNLVKETKKVLYLFVESRWLGNLFTCHQCVWLVPCVNATTLTVKNSSLPIYCQKLQRKVANLDI